MKLNVWPIITEETKELVRTVLRYYGYSQFPSMLEQRWTDFLRSRYSRTVAVSSCTHALHTVYTALGIGPGDEVITTPFKFHGI